MFSLVRVAVREDGCFGVLMQDGQPFAVTAERTFEDLRVVIPVGMHKCRATHFERGGYDTFEIEVVGHSRVLFHIGNVETDSEGCVLVGTAFGRLQDGTTAITASKAGFAEFIRRAGGLQEFDLEVR